MNGVVARLGEVGIIPVVKIEEESHAIPLMEALLAGGLPCAEITLRTHAGIAALGRIVAAYPQVSVGAGTVLTVEQAERAATAGAQFIVSPGFDADIVEWLWWLPYPSADFGPNSGELDAQAARR